MTLKVLDPDLEVDFYQRFGFVLLHRSPDGAGLGTAGGAELLRLEWLPDGLPRPSRSAGLFHFAILVPSEADLGAYVRHAAAERLPFVGAADHLVSQALYFEDPEGNQVEVYADRPPSAWEWDGARVRMATLPLDLQRLGQLPGEGFEHFPAGTLLGHMHLTVGDLDRAEAYYAGLGMDLVATLGDFFRFMSWNGYHHHLGLNLASGPGALPVRAEVAGLRSFAVDRDGLDLPAIDPDGIGLEAAD